MSVSDSYREDRELAGKVVSNDPAAWKQFVNKYSDYILANILSWCFSTCRLFNAGRECAVHSLKQGHNADSSNNCDEGIELYVYIFNALKPKLAKYQGKSSLKTFITACLKFIYSDYFISKHGKINIPVALKETTDTDKKVYKVLCRSADPESAFEKLEQMGITKSESVESYTRIVELLNRDGKEKAWQHLYSNFSRNKPLEALSVSDDSGEETERNLPVFEKDIQYTEILDLFTASFKTLSPKYQRLLKMKYRDNLSTKDFLKYRNMFNFAKEQDIYLELDKALKLLVSNLKENYLPADGTVTDLKELKDSLFDIFKVIEV